MQLTDVGNTTICPTALLVKDGLFLVGLRRYSDSKIVWTLPGGRCMANETIEHALRREVLEEVGISDFSIKELVGIVDGAKEGDVVPIYCANTSQDFKNLEPVKFIEWKWISKIDLQNNRAYISINPNAVNLVLEYLD
jgi:ADP-ribose pyrophosphatase YjhB (NUDIX family)